MLDRNKDGKLSVQELQSMLKNFNIEVPDELVLELFHNCSHTGKYYRTCRTYAWRKQVELITHMRTLYEGGCISSMNNNKNTFPG